MWCSALKGKIYIKRNGFRAVFLYALSYITSPHFNQYSTMDNLCGPVSMDASVPPTKVNQL